MVRYESMALVCTREVWRDAYRYERSNLTRSWSVPQICEAHKLYEDEARDVLMSAYDAHKDRGGSRFDPLSYPLRHPRRAREFQALRHERAYRQSMGWAPMPALP